MSYNRQQLIIDDFKGVDLSSSPLQIHSSRASFASNLINDNGVNHKRPGWKQELTFGDKHINGMCEYKNGTHEVRIVYAGTMFYEVEGDKSRALSFTFDENFQLQDQRVQFFRRKERLYIIGCGDYLVYGTWDNGHSYKLRRVYEDEDTYVPTVLSGAEGWNPLYDTGKVLAPGEPVEEINLLTPKRKKKFVGGSLGVDGDMVYPYCISVGEWMDETPGNIIIEIESYEGGRLVTKKLANGGKIYTPEYYNPSPYKEGIELCDEDGNLCGFLPVDDILDDGTGSGNYIPYNYGTICFIDDVSPPGDNAYSNITVEYSPYNPNIDDSIFKCTFGATFGAYGRSDRLFLSGNPEMKNVDFYSGFEDFTYFPTNSRTEMGSDDATITGYLRLSDSTLATFKESFGNEPSVYYRKATEVDDNGAETVAFTRWEGSVGEACINPYCVANLAGDELMLSKNGLFGIVMPENISNNDRYFRERDRYVNAELRKHDLKEAVAIVYENRYYLAVDDVCFVADPRFKTYLSDDIDGSFNYEWWYWENIPARVFAIIGGELWFGTADGKICKFDGGFTDRTYDETVEGELTADGASFTYSGEIDCDICDGNEITLEEYKDKLYITEHDPDNCTFRVSLTKGGTPIENIVSELYNGKAPASLTMKVWCYKNVVSSWYTPVFDLGAIDISKTLLSMSLTVDPTIRGKVSFGYETKNVLSLIDFKSERVFDLDNIDFTDFSFDTGFTSSYTVKVKARMFNYIMFKFISDTDSDCAVCNFKATYIYNGRHRGIN